MSCRGPIRDRLEVELLGVVGTEATESHPDDDVGDAIEIDRRADGRRIDATGGEEGTRAIAGPKGQRQLHLMDPSQLVGVQVLDGHVEEAGCFVRRGVLIRAS